MLSSKFRFHTRGALRFLFKNGTNARGRSLSLKFYKRQNGIDSRLAVVVSKKVLKSAPKRNRVRRRIFEFVRKNWQHIEKHTDIVISVHDANLLVIPSAELEDEVTKLLLSAGVWKKQAK